MRNPIGHVGRSSNGRLGIISDRRALPWGESWVGTGLDGYPWSSHNPQLIRVADTSDYLIALHAASDLLLAAGILHPLALERNAAEDITPSELLASPPA